MNSFKKHALATTCKMARHLVATTLLAMLALLLPATSARADSLVLFYDRNTGAAETGFVDTDGTFTDLNLYSGFAPWTHIAGVGGGLVLFYDRNTGAAETGFVDTNGTFTVLNVYSGFAPWTHIIGVGGGLVLFYDRNTGAAETGFVDTNGTFTDLNVYSGFAPWTHIAAP